jgi:hypothetical protein
MPNPLTTAREALWTYLYSAATPASTALKAYLDAREGKVYRYPSGAAADDVAARLTTDETPALIVRPSAAPPTPHGELLHELRFALDVVGAVAAVDPAEIEDLFWLVHRAVYSGYPSLGAAAVRRVQFDSVSFRGQGAQGGSPWFWTFTAKLVVHVRVDPEA